MSISRRYLFLVVVLLHLFRLLLLFSSAGLRLKHQRRNSGQMEKLCSIQGLDPLWVNLHLSFIFVLHVA